MSLRIIRNLWLFGNAAALASLVLPQTAGLIVLAVADVVFVVAWAWAIGRALVSKQAKWAFLIAFFPLAMWAYIFGHGEPDPEKDREAASHVPAAAAPLRRAVPSYEPLALRQARATIAEAEQRYPDW